MFERFGEMSSCREINELAENLLNEGDIQSLKTMAQENGIPEDYVEMYQSGDIPYLCDAVTAAMGKLDVECRSLKLAGLMNDWVEYIRGLCMEDEMVAHQRLCALCGVAWDPGKPQRTGLGIRKELWTENHQHPERHIIY